MKKILCSVIALGLLAYSLSVIHVVLRAEKIELIYLVICSVFLSIFITSFLFEIRKKTGFIKSQSIFKVFLSIYILLATWLILTKVIPEYNDIVDFETKRASLIYTVMTTDERGVLFFNSRVALANLYLHASKSIEKIEPNVIRKGAKMMQVLLLNKIEKNEGKEYRDDAFVLAEILFVFDKRKAKTWYKIAFDLGQLDALEIYNQRLRKRFDIKFLEEADPSFSLFGK